MVLNYLEKLQLELSHIFKLLVSKDDFNCILIMVYTLAVWRAASGSICPVLRGCREGNMIIIFDLIQVLCICFAFFELHSQMSRDWDSNCDSKDKPTCINQLV